MIQSRLLSQFSEVEHGFLVKGDEPLSTKRFVFSKQVHGQEVLWVDSKRKALIGDGLLTKNINTVVGVKTADCVPILLYCPDVNIVGAIHAGWRGTVAGVLKNAIKALADHGAADVSRIVAAFGPYIGECCYDVDNDVAEQFDDVIVSKIDGRKHVDLAKANYNQLIESGVSMKNIDLPAFCTSCQNDQFYSYRANKTDKRIISYIQLL